MKKLLTYLGVFFLCPAVLAQQQYTFTNYTQEDGLPSGTLRGIYKDTTGYIWLTSEEGVSRFDGYNFKVFRHNPDISNGLPTNQAWYGAFPGFGDIYFETAGRYCLYKPQSESFTFNMPFGDSVKIFSVDESRGIKDCYWITSKFSIFRISKAGSERFALPFEIEPRDWISVPSPDNRVLYFNRLKPQARVLLLDYTAKNISEIKILNREGTEDGSAIVDVVFTGDNFYLFNRKTVFRFDPAAKSFVWHHNLERTGNFDYSLPRFLPYNDTLVIVRSDSGFINIFNISTGEEKLVYLNKRIPEAELKDRTILTFTSDYNGGLWMGTEEMGIIHYKLFTGELEQYIHEPGNSNSLPGNFIEVIFPDQNGVIWAACVGRGLVKMEPATPLFKIAYPATTKNTGNSGYGWSQNIRGFLETDDGYWIATINGLFGFSNQTHRYNKLQYLCPEFYSTRVNSYERTPSGGFTVGSLAKDNSGNVWIGPWYGELVIHNAKLQRSFSIRPQALKDRNESVFRNLYCDRKNRMWIATQGSGVCMVDCNTLNPEKINDIKFEYNFPDANDSTAILPGSAFVVTEDAEGNIWAGTENGLCRYNEQTKKWKRYYNIPGDENSIHNSNVRSICLDKKGTLWIGTNGGGLNRYNKEQDNFTHFTTENGLINDQIYSLVCDDNGMLWMGTNRGLCRFSPEDYSCKNFTMKDGIQNYEFNTGAAIKLKDGTLLIGGVAGYNIIDPGKIENKKFIPPVVISSVKIFDKEIPIGNGHLNLKYDENRLSFEYAALSYFRNQENRYAYMLEGVDRDWIYSDTRRYVTYSQLKPGIYIFRVKACNNDGTWNERGAQLHITIMSPWWQQVWFMILCLTFSTGVVYFIYRREQNRVKQLEAVRARISRDLHDDIGSTLQSISVMSEIVRMKSKSVVPELIQPIEKIGSASREMIEKMNDIVWSVNPKNDKFENILFHMRTFAGELLAGKDIVLNFKADNGLNNVKLSMEKRKSFFLVFKEAINNAYKYSGAKNVRVEISRTNHTLKLFVEDDGCGFNLNGDGLRINGNGLKNMKTRAGELNGNFSVISHTGLGTKVILTINLN